MGKWRHRTEKHLQLVRASNPGVSNRMLVLLDPTPAGVLTTPFFLQKRTRPPTFSQSGARWDLDLRLTQASSLQIRHKFKEKKKSQAGGVAQEVGCLPSRQEALSSNPSTALPTSPPNKNVIAFLRKNPLALESLSYTVLSRCSLFYCIYFAGKMFKYYSCSRVNH
jgi:hypothetical protein